MAFCTLQNEVVFEGDYTLNYSLPKLANSREWTRDTQQYSPPNGGAVVFKTQPPIKDIRDLSFVNCDFLSLFNFWLAHVGKVWFYTNHYNVKKQAVFLNGLTVIELSDDRGDPDNHDYEIRIAIQCFPLAE